MAAFIAQVGFPLEKVTPFFSSTLLCRFLPYLTAHEKRICRCHPLTYRVASRFFLASLTSASFRIVSEALSGQAAVVFIFSSKNMDSTEEGNADLHDLRNLLTKLSCLKKDLMAPEQTITAVKELGFMTQQDIQPIGDLTGRCR